jgi:hypothetical protein
MKPNGVYETSVDLNMITNRSLVALCKQTRKNLSDLKRRENTNFVLLTNVMKSPLNPSNTPLSDMDPDTAGQLLELYSHITTLNRQYLFPPQHF